METIDEAAVLLLDLPKSALAGIDLLSFTTTPRFRGIKNLPSGFHFAFAASSTAFSERHGIWFLIPRRIREVSAPLVVMKWDFGTESLATENDEAEELRWRANLGMLWRDGLTPYRQVTSNSADAGEGGAHGDWQSLTSSVTQELLSRVTRRKASNWRLSSASSSKRDLEDIPGLTTEDMDLEADDELRFLPIDLKQTWRDGATGRERTDAAQDRSWALNDLIQNHCTDGNATEIVGEMQFCFLMVLTINNFSCLEQWKRILALLFTCKRKVSTMPSLFISAIAALRLQLQHCKDAEGGLIDLADEGGSLLKRLLARFRKGLDGLPALEVQDVLDELDDLEDYLRHEHGWQFGGSFAKSGLLELEDGEQVRMDTTAFDEDDETGEFAPQIVELTPEQARLLNVEDASDLHVSLSRTSLKDTKADEVVQSDESGTNESDDSSESEEAEPLEALDARY